MMTNKERTRNRQARLNALAASAGYPTWRKFETVCLLAGRIVRARRCSSHATPPAAAARTLQCPHCNEMVDARDLRIHLDRCNPAPAAPASPIAEVPAGSPVDGESLPQIAQ